jgi:hypothetical protein
MKHLLLLSAAILVFAGCQKTEQTAAIPECETLTDFLYLPTKDAVWEIHTQGNVKTDLSYPCQEKSVDNFDTAIHSYYVIKATGEDTVLLGKRFFRYSLKGTTMISNCPEFSPREWTSEMLLREDTANQQIKIYVGTYEEVILDFGKENVGDVAYASTSGPAGHITNLNQSIIGKKQVKMWEMSYDYKKEIKYLYKAYGIGGQIGLLPQWYINGPQPVSLDFIYKGQGSHFDFPLHPNHKVAGNSWWGN